VTFTFKSTFAANFTDDDSIPKNLYARVDREEFSISENGDFGCDFETDIVLVRSGVRTSFGDGRGLSVEGPSFSVFTNGVLGDETVVSEGLGRL